jgi:hypothetical protein
MPTATLRRQVQKLRQMAVKQTYHESPLVGQLRADPARLMSWAGLHPDPWQANLLRSDSRRTLMLCSRQCFEENTVVMDRQGRAMRIADHPDAWHTGVRPVKRYTVRGGASVTVTDNHPLYGPDGWVEAGSLRVGDRIAVLSEWGRWQGPADLSGFVEHGNQRRPRADLASFPVTEDLGKLVGYLMTDGSNRPGQSVKFTNTRPCYLAEVEALVESLSGVRAKHYPKGNGEDLLFTTTRARHDNHLMDLVRVLHWDERFPTQLFAFPPAVVAAAVNRAWAGDGCVRVNQDGTPVVVQFDLVCPENAGSKTANCTTTGTPEVFLACKNEVYGRYFQLLLMKLGVHSRMTSEWMAKCTRPFHRLVLGNGRLNLERFFGAVGLIYGKEGRSEAVLRYCRSTSKCQDYRKDDHRGEDGEVFHLAPVVRVDDLGERPVWDVAVPGKGWLVAQGVKAHNSGKSQTAAALGLKAALLQPNSLVLLLSPTLRQSGELFREKLLRLYKAAGQPVPPLRRPTQLTLELANGSRVVSLPDSEEGIRGYSSVRLLVVDEAARVSDALYYAVRPMMAVARGGIILLSTAFGRRGFFYQEWEGGRAWQRVKITAAQCPRISREFLAEERDALGERFFAQEYGCEFRDAIDAVFAHDVVMGAVCGAVAPLFGV